MSEEAKISIEANHRAMKLPGWDSSVTVAKLHASFEKAGIGWFAFGVLFEVFHMPRSSIGSFAACVLAEAIRYVYGARDKELSDNEALGLHKETEELRRYNLKVQLALSDRNIIMGSRNGDREIRQERFKEVRKYAGARALIQSVDDREARILASDIRNALEESGWNAEVVSESQSHIPEGIIESGVRVITLEDFPPELPHSVNAVVELLKLDLGPPFGPILTGVQWSPEFRGFPKLERYGFEFPEGSVVILVGTRPFDSILQADWPTASPWQ